MKSLKLKSILFSLMAVLIVSVFLVSCEEDYPKQDNNTPLINLEDAPFKKEIVTKSDDGTFTFEISSNNEKIMEAIDENSASFTFLDEYELNELLEQELIGGEADEQIESIDFKEESIEGRPYIGISLNKMITVDEDIDEIPPYKIQLGEAILDELRELKAVTVFDFQNNVEINDVIENRDVTTLWSNNKRVAIKGDCGNDKTATWNYWSNYGSSSYEWLHRSEFKCNAQITPCCKGSNSSSGNNSTWVRRVNVFQDVAPKIYGYSKDCYGSTYCSNYEKDSCSGYSPSGCY